jgi:hypothetical protein
MYLFKFEEAWIRVPSKILSVMSVLKIFEKDKETCAQIIRATLKSEKVNEPAIV